jgi:hypothetical protein
MITFIHATVAIIFQSKYIYYIMNCSAFWAFFKVQLHCILHCKSWLYNVKKVPYQRTPKHKILFREAVQEEGPGETEPKLLTNEDNQNIDQEIPG